MNSRSPSSSCRRCCIFFFFFSQQYADLRGLSVLRCYQLPRCYCWRQCPAVVTDVCSNRLCFTTCRRFNMRRSATNKCGKGAGLQRCAPFIRSGRWLIAAGYRCSACVLSPFLPLLWTHGGLWSHICQLFIAFREIHLEGLDDRDGKPSDCFSLTDL